MKKIIVVTLMLGLCACTGGEPVMTANTGGGWDKMAYVNPSYKPNWGVMKSLEQPGIY